jgi:hypothetical protein
VSFESGLFLRLRESVLERIVVEKWNSNFLYISTKELISSEEYRVGNFTQMPKNRVDYKVLSCLSESVSRFC